MVCRALCMLVGCFLVSGIGMRAISTRAQAVPEYIGSVTLSRVVRITPEVGGNYEFFRVATAPDDARRVMVCTLHTSPVTNETSAELFGSADGAETWSLKARDASSSMVSEDACAIGEKGKSYFVAQPWSIKDPYAISDKLENSEMHFYRSSGYGDTWSAFLTSSFVDYALIAIDSSPSSPFRGRAYIIGNRTSAEEFPLIAVMDDGKQLIPARQNETLKNSHGGKYPRSLIILRNGVVVASYLYAEKGSGKKLSARVMVSKDGGKTTEGPITIDESVCGAMGSPSIAENSNNGAIIAFYGLKSDSGCLPTLASSEDGGQTWKRIQIGLERVVKPSKDGIIQPCSITFRSDGIALLTWIVDKSVYAALLDSSWLPLWDGRISVYSAGKGINIAPYVRRDVRLEGNREASMDISMQFGFTHYGEDAVAAQADNSFVIVWREDDRQLYSRKVQLTQPATPNALKEVPDKDVTDLVRYNASNITFDENTNTFGYDLELLNATDTPLRGPFLLKIMKVATTIGRVTLKGVQNDEIVLVPQRGAGVLLPGEHTSAVRIQIQSPDALNNILSPANNFPRVGLIGRVYAKTGGSGTAADERYGMQ